MLSARRAIGSHDVLFVTLDTLRYDVAERARLEGRTPELEALLPGGRWERRHSPGSFTYAAHHAFFAGFLPTPAYPGVHPRLFAARFPGSETTAEETFVFDAADLPTGLRAEGYHTVCIGGVGFFNLQSPLGRALPNLFAERHWSEALGVTSSTSTERQVHVALESLSRLEDEERIFLFLNVSAIHQPNRIFSKAEQDSPSTQADALAYADHHLGRLVRAMRRRAPLLAIVCSDHGTAYGEDGLWGHRVAHPVVWEVPYMEALLPRLEGGAEALSCQKSLPGGKLAQEDRR